MAATTKSSVSATTILLLLVALAMHPQTSNAQTCPDELANMSICAPFVAPGGNSKPSAECCGALQSSVQHDCLCNTLRVASRLPSQCSVPALTCGLEAGGFSTVLLRTDLNDKFTLLEDYTSSQVLLTKWEYSMKVFIGTPPVETLVLVDTGSSIFWFQCEPCLECFPQVRAKFDTTKSSTYDYIDCDEYICLRIPSSYCFNDKIRDNVCAYMTMYGDGSLSKGVIGTDIMRLESPTGPVVHENMLFGCGRRTTGQFSGNVGGIIGLDLGPSSFLSQMNYHMFSYCLVPQGTSNFSRIHFGKNGAVTGNDVVTIPFVRGVGRDYIVKIRGISIGDETILFDESDNPRLKGNCLVDSGTPETWLPQSVFKQFKQIMMAKMRGYTQCSTSYDRLCYEGHGDLIYPEVIIHFDAGGDLTLRSNNVFLRDDNGCDCITFRATSEKHIQCMYGALVQTNFLVGYDLVKYAISFKPTFC